MIPSQIETAKKDLYNAVRQARMTEETVQKNPAFALRIRGLDRLLYLALRKYRLAGPGDRSGLVVAVLKAVLQAEQAGSTTPVMGTVWFYGKEQKFDVKLMVDTVADGLEELSFAMKPASVPDALKTLTLWYQTYTSLLNGLSLWIQCVRKVEAAKIIPELNFTELNIARLYMDSMGRLSAEPKAFAAMVALDETTWLHTRAEEARRALPRDDQVETLGAAQRKLKLSEQFNDHLRVLLKSR